MDTKDWIAPIVTLAIGASTIFISYKNYQSQTQAKPSELARLELWSKLLSESGIDVGNLPPDDKITAEQREILEGPADAEAGPRVRGEAGDVLAAVEQLALGRTVAARDAVDDRGLAGTVRANDGEQLALVDAEAHIGQRADAAKAQ